MNDKLPDSSEILSYLLNIAKEDGIVSDDENNFLTAMEKEINRYRTDLEKTLEDEKITLNEKITLAKSRKEILQKALTTVREDLNISLEEQKLLDGLERKLMELDAYEKKFTSL